MVVNRQPNSTAPASGLPGAGVLVPAPVHHLVSALGTFLEQPLAMVAMGGSQAVAYGDSSQAVAINDRSAVAPQWQSRMGQIELASHLLTNRTEKQP